MHETNADTPEFTDEQLRAALRRVGRDVQRAAFDADLPVVIVKGGSLVALHRDGTEVIVELLGNGTDAVRENE